MNFMQRFCYLWKLSGEKKLWAVYFLLSLFIIWVSLRFISMPRLAKRMGDHLQNRTASTLADVSQVNKSLEMGKLISMVAKYTPWSSSCLAQALSIKVLLNYYKIPSILYLGAYLHSTQEQLEKTMKAHAWVDVKNHTVIGAPQHLKYSVIGSFATLNH